MTKTSASVDRAAGETKEGVRRVAANPWVEKLMRAGYIARGVVYLIPGVLALELALGGRGAAVNQTGAIQVIGNMPYGTYLLILLAIGLGAYAFWGLVRATLDPFHEGDDAQGWAVRLGYIVSGLGYAVLLIATVQYVTSGVVHSNNPQDWTAKLLGQPWGRVLVGGIGLAWVIGGGLHQLYEAYQAGFRRNLKTRQLTAEERKWAIRMGRFGYAARSVVFGVIGLFLVQAAVFADPAKAKGLDGALLTLAQTSYGPWLLAIVALGLVAFGVFSILSAWWMKVRVSGAASR